jgi:hypothetical protein
VSAIVLGIVVASAPFAAVLGLLAWAERSERRRRDVYERQIALTDSIHERLGAVAAPVVHRRRHRWQVRIAVPFERPGVIEALLAIVREAFAPLDRRSLEIVLTRQPAARAAKAAGEAGVRRESCPRDSRARAARRVARDRRARDASARRNARVATAAGGSQHRRCFEEETLWQAR